MTSKTVAAATDTTATISFVLDTMAASPVLTLAVMAGLLLASQYAFTGCGPSFNGTRLR